MSRKERERLEIFERVKRKELNLKQAAEIGVLGYRQTRRMYARYRDGGARSLVHQGRGRPSNRGSSVEFREAVLARYQERYGDFGPTLAAEKLGLDGLAVDHETLRRWLLKARLWRRRRKRARHRSWRERRAHFGELVQLDGSHHQWFEKRGAKCCLMNMVDDATGTTLSLFSAEETIFSAMELLWQWIDLYGIPRALYTDRKNVYVADEKMRERAKDSGEEALTQFGRACKALGIRIIMAYSPQAKGRVERSHGTYQDRLVKELRLAGIDTTGPANEFLKGGYCEELNRKFAVPARSNADFHRSAERYDLASIFCIEEERRVSTDWVVRFGNQFYQLQPSRKSLVGRGKVLVKQYLNGDLHFAYRGQGLGYTILPQRPQPQCQVRRKKRVPSPSIMEKYVPPENHAWRSFRFGKGPPWQQT